MRRILGILSLAGILALSSCGPTTNPTTEVDLPDGTLNTGENYSKGDKIHDFTFTDVFNNTYNLEDAVQDHKLVVLNFFASWCGPCVAEFPAMQEAYAEYNNDVEMFALSVEITDTLDALKRNFQERFSATFPIGKDETNIYRHLRTSNVPTSLMIDRYGTIVDIHEGALLTKDEWVKVFERYISDSYVPPVFDGTPDNETSTSEPTGPTKPTYEMPASSEIEAVINDSSYPFSYYNATGNDLEYNWPWIISQEKGAIYPSNSGIDSSYSIINSDFTITDIYNNVLTFDYFSSTEKNYDQLYVLVDGVEVKTISGNSGDWKTAYAYVPLEPGTYTLTLCYVKDSETKIGEDKVYVKNMRFVNVNDIDENMYVKRPAASNYNENTKKYNSYQDLYLNEEDNYLHVGSKNGPLILADLLRSTRWHDEMTPYNLVSSGKGVINDVNYEQIVTDYASYAANNSTGLTPVTEDLMEALKAITNYYGDDASDNQWQELCYFYSAYGPSNVELPSPITGLTMLDPIQGQFDTFITVTFDTIIVPRGKYVAFTPTKTGAYEFRTSGYSPTYGSLYNENFEVIEESTEFTHERIINPDADQNLVLYGYLEAGKTYYLRAAFTVVEELGSFDVYATYVGESAEHLVLASTSTSFTTADEDFTLEELEIISINVPNQLDSDGYYRHVRDDGTLGSYIYADLLNASSMFSTYGNPMSIKTLVEYGGALLEWYDEDTQELLLVEDLTADLEKYIEIAEKSTHEHKLIPVNEELAGLLQRLLDYYSFYGVEGAWMKLCFYYDYFGPAAN